MQQSHTCAANQKEQQMQVLPFSLLLQSRSLLGGRDTAVTPIWQQSR